MDAGKVLLAKGNIRIKQTRHGLMAYNVNDIYVGRSLDRYGEFSHGEMLIFAQLVRPGFSVLDVGANVGPHTLYFAKAVGPSGEVVAIEPQRAMYQLLCANLALNEIRNVKTINAAAGRTAGRSTMSLRDYNKVGNFGSVEVDETAGEEVELMTIDGLQLARCDLIKIDVEGHEQSVIAGAGETIVRCRPTLYVENDRREKSPDLIRQIRDLEYRLYWHLPPLYSANNFYGNPTNVFGNIVSFDMLCLPAGDARTVKGLKEVAGPDDWPFRK